MDKEQYVKKILKHIIATDEIKERIKFDILTDIESKEESDLTIEEIISQIGNPKEVAEDFNKNYPECVYNKKKRKMGAFTIIFAVITTVCLVVGFTGRFVCLGGNSVAHIGGADNPTDIEVISEPISPLTIYEGLIKIAIVLLLITVLCAIYFFIKYRKKDRK